MPKTNEKPSFLAAKHIVLGCKIDYLRVQERLSGDARLTIWGCKTDYLASSNILSCTSNGMKTGGKACFLTRNKRFPDGGGQSR